MSFVPPRSHPTWRETEILASHQRGGLILAAAWNLALGFAFVCFSLQADDWQAGQGYRYRKLTVPASGKTSLQRLPPDATGITFTNLLSQDLELENSLRASGAGVAAGDVDGDGWCDLFMCGMQRASVLYRNLGNWKFQDITAAAGVACPGQNSTGAVFADVDGDGDLDLLLNSLGGGTRLFFNDGQGHFTEARESGLVRKFGSTSLALGDINGDGTLDLYVANYAASKIEDRPNARFSATTISNKVVLTAIDGVPMTSPELTNRYFVDAQHVVREAGEPDILYLNDGHGKFRALAWTGGIFLDEEGHPLASPPYDFGLSVMFRDMNGDRAPDIYVCNDLFPPDRIWVNNGRGGFRALSNLAVRNTSRFSMGVDFADIDRDGYDDFFVVDMLSRDHVHRKVQTSGVQPIFLPLGKIDNRPQYKRNTLFLSRGDGSYAEIAQLSGLDATEWSWMPMFLDLDLDGLEDLLVTTGYVRDSLNADAVEEILQSRRGRKLSDTEHRLLKKRYYPALKARNQAFRNRGDLTFEDTAHEWGFDHVGISQAMCMADLDNDGDLDVVVVHLNEVVSIYRNESAAPRITVRLKGSPPNTRGIGAKITLLGGALPQQSQEMICGGRYLSCDDSLRTFAAGTASNGLSIEVTWRQGAVSVVKDVLPNHLYEVDEAQAKPLSLDPKPENKLLFSDVSRLLHHTHVDEAFDDFGRQPLLAKRLSQLGPGVSWYDFDGDGRDDLIIGSGVGGRLAAYRQRGPGDFQRVDHPPLDQTVVRDQTTPLGWTKTNGRKSLLVGSANYEDATPQGSCVREYDLAQHSIHDQLPAWESSTGPVSLADWDGDGFLDLLVGGRALPGKYPDEPFSLLFRGNGTHFMLDRPATKQIVHAGLVSGAVFSDLDGDGLPELILACDWGPVRVFQRENGQWQDRTRALGLEKYSGWWNGVTVGDFDGDGRMDIAASNWGRNSRHQNYRDQPLRLYYGEWMGNGTVQALEAYYDSSMKQWMPWCSFAVARSMPWVVESFTTQASFGSASIDQILGERARTAKILEASWLDTTVFLNRGDHFKAKALPVEAQFSPAFGISVGDLDGDGNEDIFLSQNFFAVDGDTPRYDAGRGLCLTGDGQGNFRALPGQVSGVTVYGEQRGCALGDYDADGRVDLVVTQNGAETKLYHNEGAKTGLRVHLKGPPGNPDAIGALVRLKFGEQLGPAREIHAGAGYWSQDSVVPVLGTPRPPTQVFVRWPGGKTVLAAIPEGAPEVVVEYGGQVYTTPLSGHEHKQDDVHDH